MQKIRLNKNNLSKQTLPFIYDDTLITSTQVATKTGLYGYKNGELFFYDIDDLTDELEINFLDSVEEVEAAVAVCNTIVRKISASPVIYVHGIEDDFINEFSILSFINPFYKIHTSYLKRTSFLLT